MRREFDPCEPSVTKEVGHCGVPIRARPTCDVVPEFAVVRDQGQVELVTEGMQKQVVEFTVRMCGTRGGRGSRMPRMNGALTFSSVVFFVVPNADGGVRPLRNELLLFHIPSGLRCVTSTLVNGW